MESTSLQAREEMDIETREIPKKSTGHNFNIIKIGICVSVLLGVIILIIVCVTLNKLKPRDSDNIKDSPTVGGSTSLNDEERISSLYRGFFRTPIEQNEYKLKLKNAKKLSVSVGNADKPEVGYFTDVSECSAGLKCSTRRTWNWTAVIFNSVYHGCCYSHNVFSTPTYMADIYGNIQLLAQFDNKKQYVEEEVCAQVTECLACICTQLQNFVSLVYDQGNNTADYAIGLFPVAGCCKCLNI